MNAILKTTAIALRIAPYSNTSRIVVWLTEEGERLATIIKGALRPKSLFIGEYDLFNTSEVLYYQRREDGLRIVRECSLLQDRPRFRTDWRAYASRQRWFRTPNDAFMAGNFHVKEIAEKT